MEFNNNVSDEILLKRKQKRQGDFRGEYFRDTTAIIHSYPFRRLKHKTQVFFSPKNDHICTRIEHVMHVASVAATICKALDLDSDLAWAIGLGHDLGHTPFGHTGERIIRKIRSDRGGFNHEIYSLRVVDHLIGYGKGLNLTYAVRDGIVTHCGERFEQFISAEQKEKDLGSIKKLDRYPSTWEGAVVRMADKIAYLGRDVEDAIQLKVIDREMLPDVSRRVLGSSNSEIINTLVEDLIHTSRKAGKIGFSDGIMEAVRILRDFNYKNIYNHPVLTGYQQYFERILNTLFRYLEDLFSAYGTDARRYVKENNLLAVRFGDYVEKMDDFYTNTDGGYGNLVTDYIAGMTDNYAIESVSEIMIPDRMDEHFRRFLMGN